ncbi:uncharacterized protein K489DRAFT_163618 [Dissoconium aciculare CBS 342.82]|uniref:Uncharacterized protein n=1 Tax=Dissoconium aciculare CBS 342.82 TaxID=1314786 RepID=A0A6J3MC98_9PEZI|nr:uncharacterized protein K489DRAFT_163618 [Dissoconium aciculare CBS 342.82]KAF1825641.1 hypothetical protein K489DRAFT_163618 [Dissoconium aciculare CBS 342.82]
MSCPPPSCTIDRTGQQRHADMQSEDEPPERSSLRKSADDEHGIQRPPSFPPPPLRRLSSTADESTPARLVDGQAKHKPTECLRSKSRAMFCLSLSLSLQQCAFPAVSSRKEHRVGGGCVFRLRHLAGGKFWGGGSEINHHHDDDFIRERNQILHRDVAERRRGREEQSPSRRSNRIEGVSSLIEKEERHHPPPGDSSRCDQKMQKKQTYIKTTRELNISIAMYVG